MAKALVGVILGSRADFNVMRRGLESLRMMGVPYALEFLSAHRTPDRLAQWARKASDNGIEAIICGAGGSAQLAGAVACHTLVPVIAVPIDSTPLRGQDALYTLVQQPLGTPVATVGINNSENAAFLVAQILAIKYPAFREVLAHTRAAAAQRLDATGKELVGEFPDLCDPARTTGASAPRGREEEDTDPGSDPGARNGDSGVIRPGARVVGNSKLVPTPRPQEPGTPTGDPALDAETPTLVVPRPRPYPAPPSDEDLAPAMFMKPRIATPTPRSARDVVAEFLHSVEPGRRPMTAEFDKALASVETKVFQVDRAEPDEDVLSHAMMVLLEGGIVAFPTDTVYGLAVDATNADAVRRLYEVKGATASSKSLSILIHDGGALDGLVKEVPPPIESVLDVYWPGGLTVIFAKHPNVLASVTESPSIAIRIPDDPIALRLMAMVQKPLAVINAAVPNQQPATDGKQVLERYEGKIECLLDAGPCRSGKASSVISVITEPYELLREGAIPARDLKRALGDKMKDPV